MICDSHFHVFGPVERYPHAGDLRYRPPLAPLESYLLLAKKLGIQRHVFVQPSAYGRDNACMLDAMRELGPAKSRGIVDIDEHATDLALERLHAAGVRVNVNPIKRREPGFAAQALGARRGRSARDPAGQPGALFRFPGRHAPCSIGVMKTTLLALATALALGALAGCDRNPDQRAA